MMKSIVLLIFFTLLFTNINQAQLQHWEVGFSALSSKMEKFTRSQKSTFLNYYPTLSVKYRWSERDAIRLRYHFDRTIEEEAPCQCSVYTKIITHDIQLNYELIFIQKNFLDVYTGIGLGYKYLSYFDDSSGGIISARSITDADLRNFSASIPLGLQLKLFKHFTLGLETSLNGILEKIIYTQDHSLPNESTETKTIFRPISLLSLGYRF